MRHLLSLSLAILFIIGLAQTAQAGTEVDINGELRFRTEFDDRSFGEDYEMSIYNLLRTRLGVGATVDDNARFFVQLQDSRTLGSDDQSGTLANTQNVDVHQAYLKIMKLWVDGLGLKLGRFEVKLGNERVFGPVGWSNVGRSWEGAMAWYKAEQLKLTGMTLMRRELEGPFEQSTDAADFTVYGIVADIVDPAVQFFFVYEHDADHDMVMPPAVGLTVGSSAAYADDGEEDDCNNLDRMTFGGFFKNEVEDMHLDYSLNAAYQTGTGHGLDGIPSPEYDISAYMLNLEIGYSFEGERPARIAGGFDYTSGDDDVTDTDWGAYNNLYYTSHKWRGAMDYFVESNPTGLIDLMGRAHLEIAPNWWLVGDLHYFRTAEEYADSLHTDSTDGVDMTNDVGMEVDLTVKTKSIEGVQMMGGASFFMAKDAWAETTDPETGLWFYYQFMVNFD